MFSHIPFICKLSNNHSSTVLFSPTTYSNALFWYDFSDSSTVSNNGNSNGSFKVNDKTSNHHDLSLIDTTKYLQTKIVTGAINGKSVLQTNGTLSNNGSTGMQTTTIPLFNYSSTGAFAIFVIVQPLGGSINGGLISKAVAQPNPFDIRGSYRIIGNGSAYNFISSNTVNLGQSATSPMLLVFTYFRTADTTIKNFFEYKNGNLGTSVNLGNDYGDSILGTRLYIGNRGDGSQCGNHYIGEIIGINANLSEPDRQRIEGILCWKWGLNGSLPTIHPFFAAAPTSTS
jgi:hypothetical protein